jgi:hypothetical protein
LAYEKRRNIWFDPFFVSGTNTWQAVRLILQPNSRLELADGATLSASEIILNPQSVILCLSRNIAAKVDDQWAGRGVTICGSDLTLAAGASITADGQGYIGTSSQGNGPGGGAGTRADYNGGGGGGGYGGNGGNPQSIYAGGSAYGSVFEPVDLGSAGGAGFGGIGGGGGGAIRLITTNTFTLNGSISANGAAGIAHNWGASGGGAGGSVWIAAGTLSGTGSVSANGGNGPIVSDEDGGGGAGGRIALYYATNMFTGTLSAFGGAGYVAGGAGTIYSWSPDQVGGRLVLDNGGRNGAFTVWHITNLFDQLTVSNWAKIDLAGGASLIVNDMLLVGANGAIVCRAIKTPNAGQWLGLGVAIAADNLFVDEGGVISADSEGFAGTNARGDGPGGGTGTRMDTNGGGGGGGYGGAGGKPQSIYVGGPAYGSEAEPVDLGSAGGAGYAGPGGAGGGAIRLIANQAFSVNGLISANGASGAVHGYGASGGGVGGSIWITAGTLSGTGTINANGGTGPAVNEEDGGGGGGGRIALHFMTNEFAGTVSVAGGPSTGPGGQGTIHTNQAIPCIMTVETDQVAGLTPIQFAPRMGQSISWLPLANIILTNQVQSWLDSAAMGQRQRFYRAVLTP